MSSAKKTEANRRNAQKSSGPKSAEGKSRSRLNAIKHGMRATVPVLPGEDEGAFSSRLDAWTRDLKPRNEAEQYLVDRAARVSWQLDRVERGYVARLTVNMNNAAAAAAAGVTQTEGDDVSLLGARLFWDARGPMPLYPHRPCMFADPTSLVSWSGTAHDPNLPAHVVRSLESTAEGCAWLLDRWAELCSLIEQGIAWQSPDKLKAIRLLGQQPIDALDVPQVRLIFIACNMIDPSGGELFHEIWRELKQSEIEIAKQRLKSRPMDSLRPNSVALANHALYGIVDQAVERLKRIAEAYRTRDEANAKLTADLLGFNDSAEGERIRRYETSCSRTLIRTLDAFDKRHRADDDVDPDFPPSIEESVPVPNVDVDVEAGREIDIDASLVAETTNEPFHSSALIAHNAVSQPAETAHAGTQSHCEPDAIPEKQKLPNEPTVLTGAHDVAELPNEPTALSGALNIAELPNEPTVLTSAPAIAKLPNEPTALSGAPNIAELPNEPTVLTSAPAIAELPSEPTALSGAPNIAELPNEPTVLTSAPAFAELPNEPTALSSAPNIAELPNEPKMLTVAHKVAGLPNEPRVPSGAHEIPKLPNEPTALISVQHGGGRKQIASGFYRIDRDARPTAGPNRRERRAQTARGRKTRSDLIWALPPGDALLGKPPP